MKLVKLPFRILALPVMLFLGTLGMIVKLAINLSCYIIGPFMLFLIGCIVYAIVMQLWSQTAILVVLLLGCALVVFGASWLIVFLEDVNGKVIAFVHG